MDSHTHTYDYLPVGRGRRLPSPTKKRERKEINKEKKERNSHSFIIFSNARLAVLYLENGKLPFLQLKALQLTRSNTICAVGWKFMLEIYVRPKLMKKCYFAKENPLQRLGF